MKRSTLLTLALLVSSLSIFAQANKPEANSFGVQYGISYGGTLNQSVAFSGWLKNGIEVKGGSLLGFSQTDNKSGNGGSMSIGQGNSIAIYSYTESKSGSLTITPNISVLKHFNTKSNIDPFVGGLVSTVVNFQTIQSQSISETSGDNYDHYNNSLSKMPIVTTVGLSLVGGVNYFFAKNFAVGVDAGFGFTTAITNGKRTTTTVERNSGSNNPISTNQTSTTFYDNKVLTYNVNLSGNGGLRFTYYLKVKTKQAINGPQPNPHF